MTRDRFFRAAGKAEPELSGADGRTLDFYRRQAGPVTARYEAAVRDDEMDRVVLAFLQGAGKGLAQGGVALLDVGLGSGRDLARWIRAGFDGYGVDASREMVEAARALHPELVGRVRVDSLPGLGGIPSNVFDAVTCQAVLMHLGREEIRASGAGFRRVLRDGGRLVVSIPLRGPDVDGQNRSVQDGRLYTPVDAGELSEMLAEEGFGLAGRVDSADTMGRSGRSWTTLMYVLG